MGKGGQAKAGAERHKERVRADRLAGEVLEPTGVGRRDLGAESRERAACARVRTTHDVEGSSSTWRLTHSSSASSHPGTVHSAVVVEFVSVVGRHRFIAEKVSMSTSHSSARASGLSIGAAKP